MASSSGNSGISAYGGESIEKISEHAPEKHGGGEKMANNISNERLM